MNAVLRRFTLSIVAVYFDDFWSTSWSKKAQDSSAIVNTTIHSFGATIADEKGQTKRTASRVLGIYTDTQEFHLGTATTFPAPMTVRKMIQMASEHQQKHPNCEEWHSGQTPSSWGGQRRHA